MGRPLFVEISKFAFLVKLGHFFSEFGGDFGGWVYVRNQISEMANWNRTKVVTHKDMGPRMMPVLLECQNVEF